ncbi:MAG: pyruvate, water dikinase regulatory protein [Pseudomonadales bacterium]
MQKRTAYFVSDSTGVTAETLGTSLLAHFDQIEFDTKVLRYVDTLERAEVAVREINREAERSDYQPIIFETIINAEIRTKLAASKGFMIDVFTSYLAPLEQELQVQSNFTVGRGHSVVQDAAYDSRINAVHYAIDNDDGQHASTYEKADIVLVGVSRSGKTPTSIYMALQYGLYVANYPLTEDDLNDMRLPNSLSKHKDKLFGLNIDGDRLASIRQERRPDSRYASPAQCDDEIRMAESLFSRFKIPSLDTTHLSIEEIAGRILAISGVTRRRTRD